MKDNARTTFTGIMFVKLDLCLFPSVSLFCSVVGMSANVAIYVAAAVVLIASTIAELDC